MTVKVTKLPEDRSFFCCSLFNIINKRQINNNLWIGKKQCRHMQKTIKTFFPASFKVTMTVFFLKHVQGFGCTLVGLAIDLKIDCTNS